MVKAIVHLKIENIMHGGLLRMNVMTLPRRRGRMNRTPMTNRTKVLL